ncbi:hypothetical protein [Pseudonocardia sp.]|uniref:hypothetical protein n=1 Tax=Pseudonocardia sp. TaxID=60912 RepID=UPI0031FDC246
MHRGRDAQPTPAAAPTRGTHRHSLLHRWPTALGLVGLVWWAGVGIAALALVVAGLYRGVQRRGLTAQVAALVGFGGLAVVALFLAPRLGLVLVGAVLVSHVVWDAVHLRRDQVVPRSLAEFCMLLGTCRWGSGSPCRTTGRRVSRARGSATVADADAGGKRDDVEISVECATDHGDEITQQLWLRRGHATRRCGVRAATGATCSRPRPANRANVRSVRRGNSRTSTTAR